MGRIIISENISLDGVIEDPIGTEGSSFGGWHARSDEHDRDAWAIAEQAEAMDASAMLLGRKTYEFFAPRWADRPGDWADRLRALPKFVVSSSLRHATWDNTTLLSGDVLSEVTALKLSADGEIVVNGSGQLVRFLLDHDLADELRLKTYPFLLGGERLFETRGAGRSLRLISAETLGTGIAQLAYEVVRADAEAADS